MAKEQNLNLNSLKISGMCGRLLCCLGYEYKLYKEINKDMPDPGAHIQAGENTYVVTGVDTLKESIRMRHKDRNVEIFKCDLVIEGNKYSLKPEVVTRIETVEEDVPEEDTYTL